MSRRRMTQTRREPPRSARSPATSARAQPRLPRGAARCAELVLQGGEGGGRRRAGRGDTTCRLAGGLGRVADKSACGTQLLSDLRWGIVTAAPYLESRSSSPASYAIADPRRGGPPHREPPSLPHRSRLIARLLDRDQVPVFVLDLKRRVL